MTPGVKRVARKGGKGKAAAAVVPYKRRRRPYIHFINSKPTDVVNVKIPVSAVFREASAISKEGFVKHGYFMPFFCSGAAGQCCAVVNNMYREMCAIYDEVKCIGAKITVTIHTPVGISGSADAFKSLVVTTRWDRRVGYIESSVDTSYANIVDDGSHEEHWILNNTVPMFTTRCYPHDLIEKAQWHDCSLDTAVTTPSDRAFLSAGSNPNFFSPGLKLAFQAPNVEVMSAQDVEYAVDCIWYLSFRNPKYGH